MVNHPNRSRENMSFDEKAARAAASAERSRLAKEHNKAAKDAHKAEVARLKRAAKRA
jgi:hypothetical protein